MSNFYHSAINSFIPHMQDLGYTHRPNLMPLAHTHTFSKGAHDFHVTHALPSFGTEASHFGYVHSGGHEWGAGHEPLNLENLKAAFNRGIENGRATRYGG